MTLNSLDEIKKGMLVYHRYLARWGVVSWEARKVQFETGQPETLLVAELFGMHHNRAFQTALWKLADIHVVAKGADVVWHCLDHEQREVQP